MNPGLAEYQTGELHIQLQHPVGHDKQGEISTRFW
jgi:hypothetical protein